MQKKKIVTIAGKPGSGKSTTSKGIASSLGYKHFSSGDLFRAIAREHGIDVYQVNLRAETESSIDKEVDAKLREIGASEEEIVIDSRMAWHWMPFSFKIYLDLDLETAAARILKGMDPARMADEDIPATPSAYAKQLERRLESENKRYMNLYGQNPHDLSNYDLVIDTGENDPKAVQKIIIEAYEQWLEE